MISHPDEQSADDPQEDDNGPGFTATHGREGAAEVLDSAFDGLSARQSKAVEALLREPTLTRAAALAGVHERTLRRWMTIPTFKAAVLAARREAFGQAVGLSQRYAPVAVATLVKVMNDIHASHSARVTAAALLLRFGREGIELDDIVARLEALERSAWGGKGPVAGALDANPDEQPDDEEEPE